MSRIEQWFSYKNPIFSKFTIDACCDIGSSSSRVVLGKKLVFNQPTCLAVHQQTGEIVAYGKKAYNFLGKTPHNIEIVFPINRGRVADKKVFIDLLNILYRDAILAHSKGVVVAVQGKFGVAVDLSPVERDIFSKALKNCGFAGMQLIEQNQGLVELYRQRNAELSLCILDLGATKTEISVFSLEGMVFQKSIGISGNELNTEIVKIIRNQFKLDIGWVTAEEIKRQVLIVNDGSTKHKEKQIIVRGKDMLTNLVRTEKISSSSFDKLTDNFVSKLMEEIQLTFSDISAKAVSDAMENGLFLTGGASQLQGLGEYLSLKLGVEVIKTAHPETDGVIGLALKK